MSAVSQEGKQNVLCGIDAWWVYKIRFHLKLLYNVKCLKH